MPRIPRSKVYNSSFKIKLFLLSENKRRFNEDWRFLNFKLKYTIWCDVGSSLFNRFKHFSLVSWWQRKQLEKVIFDIFIPGTSWLFIFTENAKGLSTNKLRKVDIPEKISSAFFCKAWPQAPLSILPAALGTITYHSLSNQRSTPPPHAACTVW